MQEKYLLSAGARPMTALNELGTGQAKGTLLYMPQAHVDLYKMVYLFLRLFPSLMIAMMTWTILILWFI